MSQYFFHISVQAGGGPASMAGVTVWEHGATRYEIYDRIRKEAADKLGLEADHMPVLSFTLERNI